MIYLFNNINNNLFSISIIILDSEYSGSRLEHGHGSTSGGQGQQLCLQLLRHQLDGECTVGQGGGDLEDIHPGLNQVEPVLFFPFNL